MRVSIQQCLIWLIGSRCDDARGIPRGDRFLPNTGGTKTTNHEKIIGRHSWDQDCQNLFFIAPGCSACPDEAAKLESELNRIGLKYQIEGVFVGDPPQVGKYLAALRTYPFKFELALDMDGKITKQYGVKTFPSAAVEVDGKKFVITKAAELEAKLR